MQLRRIRAHSQNHVPFIPFPICVQREIEVSGSGLPLENSPDDLDSIRQELWEPHSWGNLGVVANGPIHDLLFSVMHALCGLVTSS